MRETPSVRRNKFRHQEQRAERSEEFPSEPKSSMLKLLILVYPSRFLLLLICFLTLSLAPRALAAQAQGPQRVPVPVPPPAKRAPSSKKDRQR